MPRLYHFEFEGIDQKITIQAEDRKRARTLLKNCLQSLPQYAGHRLIGETTQSLVAGVTKRIANNITLIWAGKEWEELKNET